MGLPHPGEGDDEGGIRTSEIAPADETSRSFVFCATRSAVLVFTLLLFLFFVLGVSRVGSKVLGLDGWDEVLAVIGSYCFFPAAVFLYHMFTQMPRITRALGGRLCFHLLQLLLLLTYIAQQGTLMAYLVRYVNKLCWLFAIPDVVVAAMLVAFLRSHFGHLWSTLFVLLQAGKLVTLWPQIDKDLMPGTHLGADGLLGALMLTIPMVQFPVLISRLRAGMSLTEAYTTNMAALFAHVLHFMDVLDLYFSGMGLQSLPEEAKQLVLFFAVMGHVTCNLYYASLFFKDEATMRFLRRFEKAGRDGNDLIAPNDPATDDELLHYFLWTVFFIDLPYAVMRLVALVVNGKNMSTFFGKNIMMMMSVVMLLVQGHRS